MIYTTLTKVISIDFNEPNKIAAYHKLNPKSLDRHLPFLNIVSHRRQGMALQSQLEARGGKLSY